MASNELIPNLDHSSSNMVEDILDSLNRESISNPFCWLVCYEERPLQGAPQNSIEPHLMIFTTKSLGIAFIKGRSRIFGPEPLKVIPIDSPGSLSKISLAQSRDSRYSSPPCGLLLNFSYSSGTSDVELPPQKVQQSGEAQLALTLGLNINTPIEEKQAKTNKVESNTCPLCKHPLYMPTRGGGLFIGFGDDAASSLLERRGNPEHNAYACRKCGTRICKSCATKFVCPQCGNNTFDRYDLLEVEPSPNNLGEHGDGPTLTAIPKISPLGDNIPKVPSSFPQVSEPESRRKKIGWAYLLSAAFIGVILLIIFLPRPLFATPVNMAETSPTSVTKQLALVQGNDIWTIMDINFLDSLVIPYYGESLSASTGSKVLVISFYCDTGRNPLTLLYSATSPQVTSGLPIYEPDGINNVYVTDEMDVVYPVSVIMLFSKDISDGFALVTIVPDVSNSYRLHFMELPTVDLDWQLVSVLKPMPAGTDSLSPIPSEVLPTQVSLPAVEPIVLEGGQEFGMDVAFSPPGSYVASGNCDGVVRIWSVINLKVFQDYVSPGVDCTSDIAFNTDENQMAVAFTNQGLVFIFNVQSGELLGKLSLPRVDEVKFSPDGAWIAAGSQGHGTALWKMSLLSEYDNAGAQPILIESEDNYFTCLQFSPDSNLLAFGEGYGGVVLWDIVEGRILRTLIGDCKAPESMNFSPDGKSLSFSTGESVSTWSVATGDKIEQLEYLLASDVNSASAFSSVQDSAAISYTEPGKSTIVLINYHDNRLITSLEGHTGPIYSLEFSQDGRMLISGGTDLSSGEVFLWDLGMLD